MPCDQAFHHLNEVPVMSIEADLGFAVFLDANSGDARAHASVVSHIAGKLLQKPNLLGL